MNFSIKNQFPSFLVLIFLLAILACNQGAADQAKEEGNTTASPTIVPPLTMADVGDGKWVIMDSKKTVLYDVFIYDNGPDQPAEGLFRVVEDGRIGYADAGSFAIVIDPQFECAYPFENGKAKVSFKCKTVKDGEHSVWESETWQYVDRQGNFGG
jgi:hypothetical protein